MEVCVIVLLTDWLATHGTCVYFAASSNFSVIGNEHFSGMYRLYFFDDSRKSVFSCSLPNAFKECLLASQGDLCYYIASINFCNNDN